MILKEYTKRDDTMKRLIVLFLSLLIILSACGQNKTRIKKQKRLKRNQERVLKYQSTQKG